MLCQRRKFGITVTDTRKWEGWGALVLATRLHFEDQFYSSPESISKSSPCPGEKLESLLCLAALPGRCGEGQGALQPGNGGLPTDGRLPGLQEAVHRQS